MSVDLRALHWWDLQDVMTIERDAFPETAWTPAMFWSELAGVPETRCYFAAVDSDTDELLGYAGLLAVAPQADVQTIAVADKARGQRLGARLMSALIAEARERGCTELLLEVREDNQPAVSLYTSRGFEVIARRRDYYGTGIHALAMRLRPLPESA